VAGTQVKAAEGEGKNQRERQCRPLRGKCRPCGRWRCARDSGCDGRGDSQTRPGIARGAELHNMYRELTIDRY
jgi:hypothetical protein